MSDDNTVVRVSNLGKRYDRVHEKPMLLRDILLLAGRRRRIDDLWALRGISFDVPRGETFGLLGPNGSGKTTLLSLIAGTNYPDEGSVSTRGRISTLLDLGSGFSNDMTGEENVIVSAGLLGIPVDEARRRLAGIIAFAELSDVVDTPLRQYSSGMVARLGFSVAISASPDLLVVDEVLAVGDMRFQQKCASEFRRLSDSGVTVVLATQSPDMLRGWCQRALWLMKGEVRRVGSADEVADDYARWAESGAVA